MLFFIFVFHCFLTSSITLPWTIARFYAHFTLSVQSDSQHFHFQPFRDLLSQFYRERYGFEWAFFTLCSFINILSAFLKASLGAGSSSLTFAGLHTDPRNAGLAHLFVWFTVFHNLHIQNDSFLNSTKYYHELLVVKVNLSAAYSFRIVVACSKSYVKTIKNTLRKTKLVLLITTSMNIKVILKKQPGIIRIINV